MAPFQAGPVIYWAWSNTLSIAQQYSSIMRKHGAPVGGKAPDKAAAVPAIRFFFAPAPANGSGGTRQRQEGQEEGLMPAQDFKGLSPRRSRRRASSSRVPADLSLAKRRSKLAHSGSRCPKSPSPAAPMSASRVLVNALTGRRTLARTSSSPGHTRQINFFNLGDRLNLVDLPGYGFAQVSRSMKETWQDLASAFLRGRPTLKRVCLLIDSRHGVKDRDRETMKNLDAAAVSYQLILTKTDYLKHGGVARARRNGRRRWRASMSARIPSCCRPAAKMASGSRNSGRKFSRSRSADRHAASWKMMPSVKRSPLRRLETAVAHGGAMPATGTLRGPLIDGEQHRVALAAAARPLRATACAGAAPPA